MEFLTGDDYLLLNKKTYVQELIVKVDMSNDNPFPTPITGTCIKHTGYGYIYWIVLWWVYLSLYHRCLALSKPDTHFTVNKLSMHMQSPCSSHWTFVLHIIRYLKGTLDDGLLFRTTPSPTNEISLVFFSRCWLWRRCS